MESELAAVFCSVFPPSLLGRPHSRVRAHPTDCNVAYVAAVGNLWKATTDRGVYKTMDGGRTWNKLLYVDSLTGATDIAMDPRDRKTVFFRSA